MWLLNNWYLLNMSLLVNTLHVILHTNISVRFRLLKLRRIDEREQIKRTVASNICIGSDRLLNCDTENAALLWF